MIKMAIATRRIVNSYNHKEKKMRTTKIKITTRRIANSYNK